MYAIDNRADKVKSDVVPHPFLEEYPEKNFFF